MALQSITFCSYAVTYVPFLQEIGLSLNEIALINAAFWFTIILMEVPTGMLADGKSRSWAIRLALILQILALCFFFIAENVWTALIGEVMAGISFSFLSGIETAWVTDAMKRDGEEDGLRNIFARSSIVRGLVAPPAALVGCAIGLLSLRATWLIGILTAIICLCFAVKHMNGQGEPIQRVSEYEALKQSLQKLRTNRELIWVVLATLSLGLCVPFNTYWIPYFQFELDQIWMGVIFSVIFCPVALGGWIVKRFIISKNQEAVWIAFSLFLSGVGLFAISYTPGIALPVAFILLHEAGRGAFGPVTESFIQHRIESQYRATFGSIKSLLSRLGNGGILILVAWYMSGREDSKIDICQVFFACGGIIMLASVILWLCRKRS